MTRMATPRDNEKKGHEVLQPRTLRSARGEKLREQRDLAFILLAWIAIAVVVLWLLSHVIGTILMCLLAVLIASAIAPIAQRLHQLLPQPASIALVYLGVVSALVGLLTLFTLTVLGQVTPVERSLLSLVQPGAHGEPSSAYQTLTALGLPDGQTRQALSSFTSALTSADSAFLSLSASAITTILQACLVGVLSVYFVADGQKFRDWLLTQCPLTYRRRLRFLLNTIHTVMTGYIRGQMLLSLLIATLVGVGMWLFGVPHPLFLAAVAFVFECVPVVGFWIMGAVCVILALTVSWTTALLALGYFVIASNIEANVAAPRILGRAVHVHPVVSLVALLAGAEAFGLWGALFAAPAIGVAQALLGAEWTGWRETHPREFPEVATTVVPPTEEAGNEREGTSLFASTSVINHTRYVALAHLQRVNHRAVGGKGRSSVRSARGGGQRSR